MNDSTRIRRGGVVPEATSAEELLRAVSEAHSSQTEAQLRAAVCAARQAGIEWGKIGDVLGIARGNAYQRYRREAAQVRQAQQAPPL
jgi:hypothetical protein